MQTRQKIRNGLILFSFFLFPAIFYYLSPVLIIQASSKGVINGSFILFVLMFISSLFVGRSYCGWVCPGAGCQEAIFICMFTPKWREHSNVLDEQRTIQREIAAKKQDIKRLQIRQDRFTSEASFVERTARECGMIKRGEIVYKFPAAAAQAARGVN